jgi:hypothetical protein
MAMKVQGQAFILSFEQLMWFLLIMFGFALIPLSQVKSHVNASGPVDAH